MPGNVAEHVLTIELDVKLSDTLHLKETFEWDQSDPDNCPEEFAAQLVSDFLYERKLTHAGATTRA